MEEAQERRHEKRLRYHWPIWYGDNFNGILTQGQMLDINSSGAAFTCYNDNCPDAGQHITARFSVPKYSEDESFDIENFIRNGRVCRVQEISPFIRKVAVQFEQVLSFRPGEQSYANDFEAEMISN
jgi:hypothetical protein